MPALCSLCCITGCWDSKRTICPCMMSLRVALRVLHLDAEFFVLQFYDSGSFCQRGHSLCRRGHALCKHYHFLCRGEGPTLCVVKAFLLDREFSVSNATALHIASRGMTLTFRGRASAFLIMTITSGALAESWRVCSCMIDTSSIFAITFVCGRHCPGRWFILLPPAMLADSMLIAATA